MLGLGPSLAAPGLSLFCSGAVAIRILELLDRGATPIDRPPQLGTWSVAPFVPHRRQRAHARSMSLEASGPQRMMKGANATGCGRRQRELLQETHSHGA
jgi:hypothetical protein